MVDEKLDIFVASGCGPCDNLKEQLEKSNVSLEGVSFSAAINIHDIITEEGYSKVKEYELDGVPTAFVERAGKRERCSIVIDEESKAVTIACPLYQDVSAETPAAESPAAAPAADAASPVS